MSQCRKRKVLIDSRPFLFLATRGKCSTHIPQDRGSSGDSVEFRDRMAGIEWPGTNGRVHTKTTLACFQPLGKEGMLRITHNATSQRPAGLARKTGNVHSNLLTL